MQSAGVLAGADYSETLANIAEIDRITGLLFPHGLSSQASAHSAEVFQGYKSGICKTS